MHSILLNYFGFKIVLVLMLGYGYSFYRDKRIHPYLYFPMSILFVVLLTLHFLTRPGLISNIHKYNSLKGLTAQEVMKISIVKDGREHMIHANSQQKLLLGSLKKSGHAYLNHPIVSNEYDITLHLENKKKIKLSVEIIENADYSAINLTNSYRGMDHNIGTYRSYKIDSLVNLMIENND